jgi:hypothetical protein
MGKGSFLGIGKTVKGCTIGKGVFHTPVEPGILSGPFGKGAYQGPGQEFLESQGRISTNYGQGLLIPGEHGLSPEIFQHKDIQNPFKKSMGSGKSPGPGVLPGNPACFIDNIRMTNPVQNGMGHKAQGIGSQGANPLFPPEKPDIPFIRRRVREARLEERRGKHPIPPAVEQGAVFQGYRPGRLVMIKNIRPLTAQGKGGFIINSDLFRSLAGYNSKTLTYTPVYPGYDVFPKKGMQNLGGHIVNISPPQI